MGARTTLGVLATAMGPAFVAAIAYVDPGNFATGVVAGSRFGFLLLWVVVSANLIAMPIQYLSAKLGVVTGLNLAEACGQRFCRPVRWGLWLQAEVVAMATDIAEFMGAAIGLNLVFGMPLVPGAGVVGAVTLVLLASQRRGHRGFELVITALFGVILTAFLYTLLHVGLRLDPMLAGLAPALSGKGSVLLAAGIVGATVMPHAIYLHSALTSERVRCRDDAERARVLRYQQLDVGLALGLAGLVNLAILALAAELFHHRGHAQVGTIQQAHVGMAALAGGGVALAFAFALLVSGISSASVGTYAGQVAMQGFTNVRIPLLLRRLVTMVPAIGLLVSGFNPTSALVLSQVVLSFGIPFALVPLILVCRDPKVMGKFANGPVLTTAVSLLATVIAALDAATACWQFGLF
ncbi:MAG TPA: Nramp family divalent metal transporter [Streptosporangiaceae bacterium]|nr:Nramp family divalent metal transporter [Streptosporangiaceae bacterium]